MAHTAREVGQFDEGGDHLGDYPVSTGDELLSEVSDPAETGRKLNLDTM